MSRSIGRSIRLINRNRQIDRFVGSLPARHPSDIGGYVTYLPLLLCDDDGVKGADQEDCSQKQPRQAPHTSTAVYRNVAVDDWDR